MNCKLFHVHCTTEQIFQFHSNALEFGKKKLILITYARNLVGAPQHSTASGKQVGLLVGFLLAITC